MFLHRVILTLLFFCAVFLSPTVINAQEPKNFFSEAVINTITESTNSATLAVTTKRAPLEDRQFMITADIQNLSLLSKLNPGDEIIVSYLKEENGQETVYITDVVRKSGTTILFIVFIAVVVVIGRWSGVRAFLGMLVSFGILFGMLYAITLGYDAAITSILGALLLIPTTFYISHGLHFKTHVAAISTLITFGITVGLSYLFSNLMLITGYSNGEAVFLQTVMQNGFNLQTLYIAGIVIGVVGVLDDITISQAGIVKKLYEANKAKNMNKIATEAMELGRDHIASLVNTLVLVYVGSSLPLMLLFFSNTMPSFLVLNQEIIAAELLRMLVSSMGIILAVPIATYMAIFFLQQKQKAGLCLIPCVSIT
jgi:uncharacterized membrane protein